VLSDPAPVRISAALMYHPLHRRALADIIRACAPLAVTPVADPEPHGPPSPLRTAKRAWSAGEPERSP
jgi:hypothetical protein